jgi:hypothetical protein
VIWAGQPGDAPELFDSRGDCRIVGRDNHRVHAVRLGRAPIHVLDHRPAGDIGERFTGETGRGVSGGNDCDRL